MSLVHFFVSLSSAVTRVPIKYETFAVAQITGTVGLTLIHYKKNYRIFVYCVCVPSSHCNLWSFNVSCCPVFDSHQHLGMLPLHFSSNNKNKIIPQTAPATEDERMAKPNFIHRIVFILVILVSDLIIVRCAECGGIIRILKFWGVIVDNHTFSVNFRVQADVFAVCWGVIGWSIYEMKQKEKHFPSIWFDIHFIWKSTFNW